MWPPYPTDSALSSAFGDSQVKYEVAFFLLYTNAPWYLRIYYSRYGSYSM
jgi:hypothetical protein